MTNVPSLRYIFSLQVNIAKVQQSLPELRRDGSTVLSSLTANLMYDERTTSRANGILPQSDFIPRIAQRLQENPDEVIKDFETIRQYSKSHINQRQCSLITLL